MQEDKHKTIVIFRRFRKGGNVIALFPELPGTDAWYKDCLSYQTIGQHGDASVDIDLYTTLANADNYKALKKELENIGYNLKVVPNFNAEHLAARKRAVEKVK